MPTTYVPFSTSERTVAQRARSFELNDEIMIGIVDRGIASELREAFQADLKYTKERKFEEWQNRSLWHKLKDGLAYLANEQL